MATKTASTNNNKGVFQNSSDVHISFEDQQKINCFAKHNARMDDIKVELDMKRNELKNIEEALDEIELFDEEEEVPVLMGEVFLTCKQPRAQEHLIAAKEQTQREIAQIEAKANKIRAEMNELKSHLYQRFGSNISLESDD